MTVAGGVEGGVDALRRSPREDGAAFQDTAGTGRLEVVQGR
jgi:hypothetical protein